MIACCTIWGLSGLYYKMLAHVSSLEVLAHRTIWSMVFFALILMFQGRLRQVGETLRDWSTMRWLIPSALMISVNWFGFVYAIQQGWAMDASLGYYIFPLMAVVLGAILLGEKISVFQGIALLLATVAVLVLGIGLGVTPWIAIFLATTFSIYGLIKRRVTLGPVMSVFIEALILTPIALLWALTAPSAVGFSSSIKDAAILIGSGPMTAIPLLFFSYAARRISFATVGLVQYLNPTLQFTVAVLVFGEVFTRWHGIAFPLIWVALAIYSVAAFRNSRQIVP